MLIGITGRIGSGKSEAARILKGLGAFIISADKVGRDVVETNPALLKKLVKFFGWQIITSRGKLKRRHLGRLAFSSPENRVKLNKLVHPYLLKELQKQTREAVKRHDVVIIDAALLIDWGWQERVDLTLLIHCGKQTQLSRLIQKGLTREEAAQRLKSQLSYRELRRFSDIVIFNNRDRDYLQNRLYKYWKVWVKSRNKLTLSQ